MNRQMSMSGRWTAPRVQGVPDLVSAVLPILEGRATGQSSNTVPPVQEDRESSPVVPTTRGAMPADLEQVSLLW